MKHKTVLITIILFTLLSCGSSNEISEVYEEKEVKQVPILGVEVTMRVIFEFEPNQKVTFKTVADWVDLKGKPQKEEEVYHGKYEVKDDIVLVYLEGHHLSPFKFEYTDKKLKNPVDNKGRSLGGKKFN